MPGCHGALRGPCSARLPNKSSEIPSDTWWRKIRFDASRQPDITCPVYTSVPAPRKCGTHLLLMLRGHRVGNRTRTESWWPRIGLRSIILPSHRRGNVMDAERGKQCVKITPLPRCLSLKTCTRPGSGITTRMMWLFSVGWRNNYKHGLHGYSSEKSILKVDKNQIKLGTRNNASQEYDMDIFSLSSIMQRYFDWHHFNSLFFFSYTEHRLIVRCMSYKLQTQWALPAIKFEALNRWENANENVHFENYTSPESFPQENIFARVSPVRRAKRRVPIGKFQRGDGTSAGENWKC